MSNLAIATNDDDNRSRTKISAEQVYEILADGEWHTTAEMSGTIKCGADTIRGRVREILDDGHMVLKGPKGMRLATGTELDQETMDEIRAMINWVFKSVGSMAKHSVPIKKVLPQMRKALPKTVAERNYLRTIMVKVTHLIDWESIDDLDVVG